MFGQTLSLVIITEKLQKDVEVLSEKLEEKINEKILLGKEIERMNKRNLLQRIFNR